MAWPQRLPNCNPLTKASWRLRTRSPSERLLRCSVPERSRRPRQRRCLRAPSETGQHYARFPDVKRVGEQRVQCALVERPPAFDLALLGAPFVVSSVSAGQLVHDGKYRPKGQVEPSKWEGMSLLVSRGCGTIVCKGRTARGKSSGGRSACMGQPHGAWCPENLPAQCSGTRIRQTATTRVC